MNIDRQELYKKLLAVSPGLTSQKDPVQGDCVVIRRGRFYTFNGELAGSILSGLDKEMEGAVKASAFLGIVKALTEKEIEVDIDGKKLVVTGIKRGVKLNMEAEIFLPVDSVEIPKDWVPLKEGWPEAIDVAFRCTNNKSKDLGRKCIHITPGWIEASDNDKAVRWKIETFIKKACLIRGVTLKEIGPLGVTKGCETKNWLHFHNPFGLRMSVRKCNMDGYPDLTPFYNKRGAVMTFPPGMADAAKRGSQVLDDKGGCVKINLQPSGLKLTGDGVIGEYWEDKDVVYQGRSMIFKIPPKLIAELVEKHTTCEVSEVSLRVDGGAYVYVTSLVQ